MEVLQMIHKKDVVISVASELIAAGKACELIFQKSFLPQDYLTTGMLDIKKDEPKTQR